LSYYALIVSAGEIKSYDRGFEDKLNLLAAHVSKLTAADYKAKTHYSFILGMVKGKLSMKMML
jgi:hypothetical protein